ncbi:MAG: transporter substrate-binding domain-containing protein [Desulfobacterales bacterium]|nr:transporter substrate-binding domain-containing protein [Desulfobacterales bacterium]
MRQKLSITILLCLFFLTTRLNAQGLKVLFEDSPPLSYLQEDQLAGCYVEIVREIFHRLNLSEDIQLVPWARGYEIVQSSPYIALIPTARTQKREHLFKWVGPLNVIKVGFFAKKGSGIRITSLEDLKKVRAIGTYKHDVREEFLIEKGFTNFDSTNSNISNLKKLIAGRIDLWFSDDLTMNFTALQAGIDPSELELLYSPHNFTLYIAISKKTPDRVVAEWQATLNDLKSDGTFKKKCKKWFTTDNIPSLPDHFNNTYRSAPIQIYTENSPPGNYLADNKLQGLAVEVVYEILRRLQLKINIKVVPWARGYALLQTMPNVALFSTTRLPQREKLFKWVGPLYTQQWGFYAKKGSDIRINSLEDAKNVARIGTYHNDAKEQYLLEKGFTNLVCTNKNTANVKHLIQGGIDLWVSSDFNMHSIAYQAKVNPAELELVYPLCTVQNYIAFSIQTPDEIVKQWQETLDAIKKDGFYQKLYTKYTQTRDLKKAISP